MGPVSCRASSARQDGPDEYRRPDEPRDPQHWAIFRCEDEHYTGEVVLNELDADNGSMNLRIALAGDFGRGYGTEAVRAAVAYGLDVT